MKKYILAITTVLIWSTTASMVKSMLNEIPNLQALAVGSFIAFACLLVMNLFNGSVKQMKQYTIKDYGKMAGLGFIGLFLYSALYYYGLSQLTSQQACVLNYLWPMMLVVFSCLILKEKLTLMKLVAMICSFVGIIILTSGIDAEQSTGNVVGGVLSCLAAAAFYGLFSVLNKKADLNQNIAMMVIWLTTGICSTIVGLPTEEWVAIEGTQWLGVLWLGGGINALAYLLWALALREAENTATVANLAYLTPFLSLVVSVGFLKEKMSVSTVLALVFIVGGILMQSLHEAKTNKES